VNFESVVLILASAQAFLLALLIYQKRRAVYANRFLFLMLTLCGIAVIHMLIEDEGFYDSHPQLLFFVLGIPFLVAPLYYLYIKYLVSREETFSPGDWFHFSPAAAIEATALAMALAFPDALPAPAGGNAAAVPAIYRVYNWVLLTSGMLYTFNCLRLLFKYRGTMKDVVSFESVRLKRLTSLTIAALAIWFMGFAENTLMAFGINLSNFVMTSVFAGILVFIIGYMGLLRSEMFEMPVDKSTTREILEIASVKKKTDGKYEKSGLDTETSDEIMRRLVELMEETKPFTNPSLTLAQLAAMLSVTPHNLSEVINTKSKQNFYDFVNGYRIEQVKKDLSNVAKENLKILSIAFDAGFNSKASFNGIFKEATGVTPSEYRKNALRLADKV
jgi:AraC-like DNA-binding protein